ncbi:putative mitochondrial carrier C29A3.11c [Choanephora cucurbitarum]|uniref:Putative mitochondrial carrier C29A3.11c n=1 Tax=Choanephora cucurbitarum TaxID=101091 RepID=A0A1C7NS43_9FUNG|nr:putative mitochondrial carrier C29A3.11c [Choanephora cucurbitarum]
MSKNDTRKVHPLPFKSIYQEALWSNRTIVAASAAAVVGVISGYPFDSIKTRLQTQHYDSIGACIKQTYKDEGIRGLFRGVVPPLVTVSIIKSISFSVYENTKAYCKAHHPVLFNQDTMLSTMSVSTFAGGVSGALIALLSCPFELVKVQKQLEFLLLQTSSISAGVTVMHIRPPNELPRPTIVNKTTVGAGLPVKPIVCPPVIIKSAPPLAHKDEKLFTSTSSWHSVREIIKKRGLFGLYSGFTLHLVRDTIGTGVYFGGYETTKYVLNGSQNASSAGPLTQFLAGGICGIMCWIVVFPLDLVKTLIQKEILVKEPKYKSTIECVQDIYSRDRLAGFYRGITVTLIRAFPIHSLNFLVYEQTLLLIKRIRQDNNA